jgi:16S rRNA (cytosine967-C5)-methyltransferase
LQRDKRALPPGFAARQAAVSLLAEVLQRGRTLDDAMARAYATEDTRRLEARDRALARHVATTALRRRGECEAVLSAFLEKPLPEQTGHLRPILLAGAAQLLALDMPPHAVISLAVEQCRADPRARRFDRLANAVLRRVAAEGSGIAAKLDATRLNIPDWLWRRWEQAYGADRTRRIANASLAEAPLDLSVKSDAPYWAERLGGRVLPTGSVRLEPGGRIEDLPGYKEGAWWVQDAAAALPAKLLGDVEGLEIADLCAAPGGKTAQLVSAGARVTAVDNSEARLERLAENLDRLDLKAAIVAADAAVWTPGRAFDAVLIDAPCSATGTIRRHPDILHLKREGDIAALAQVQGRLLANAARLVKPDGVIVYGTCSLELEEGERQTQRFLHETAGFVRVPVVPQESGIVADWVTPEGDLRTFPFHMPGEKPELSGLDGFFAARLRRLA